MFPVKNQNLVLFIIVIAQFFCTSLWFASNGVMIFLHEEFQLVTDALGHLTSAVQFGFILGTLVFALLSLPDRFSPSKVFFFSALMGAGCNFMMVFEFNSIISLLLFRFLTGFFLAGIYPVGMKIAADYFEKGLGKSLGFLVGALVLGTALPHLLKEAAFSVNSWQSVIHLTSILAIAGGLLILILVPDGPYRKSGDKFVVSNAFKVFKNSKFRAAAFGYFGHMWELYAFWVFVPLIVNHHFELHSLDDYSISMTSFWIIAIGSLGCILAGKLSFKYSAKRIAFMTLLLSGVCCLLSAFFIQQNNLLLLILFLLFWGFMVIADSPLFSTLVAQNAPSQLKGTALTIVNCIGFAISIVSIQLLTQLFDIIDFKWLFVVLAVGPVFGLISLLKEKN